MERWAPVAEQVAAERWVLAGQVVAERSAPETYLVDERLLAQIPGLAAKELRVGAPLLAGETWANEAVTEQPSNLRMRTPRPWMYRRGVFHCEGGPAIFC